jgi:transcriptional regulator with GAF, ATPase, and Fis domain
MRDDFYYRLCSTAIEVPFLRTRIAQTPSELSLLIEHPCERVTLAAAESRELARSVLSVIERDLGASYAFAGNVRELEQCVRRVLMTGRCSTDAASGTTLHELPRELADATLSGCALLDQYCALLHARTGSYFEVARIRGSTGAP